MTKKGHEESMRSTSVIGDEYAVNGGLLENGVLKRFGGRVRRGARRRREQGAVGGTSPRGGHGGEKGLAQREVLREGVEFVASVRSGDVTDIVGAGSSRGSEVKVAEDDFGEVSGPGM